jgi:hypothetical protein
MTMMKEPGTDADGNLVALLPIVLDSRLTFQPWLLEVFGQGEMRAIGARLATRTMLVPGRGCADPRSLALLTQDINLR